MALRLQLRLGPHSAAPDETTITAPPPATWPFLYPLAPDLPSGSPASVAVAGLHEAFVNLQSANTRLVTTQASYLMLEWMAAVGDRDVRMVASADEASLQQHAPEVLGRRGIFSEMAIDIEPATARAIASESAPTSRPAAPPASPVITPAHAWLAEAMRAREVADRLALCVRALDAERSAGALVATASVCMEVNDLDAAARDLDEALERAPDWTAAHFERGKLWLRRDDMERASHAFRAAAERLPRFGSAWSNLGATLGELDRPEEALAAFARALECDPASAQTLNNIGVVKRELGRLAESEAAFRDVIALAPDLAFGYYNLGHTLFLSGRYQAALGAYAEGQRRDPERNPVQASRLALCRLATGDANGAVAELDRATSALPREYRQQLLADTHSIAWALLTHRPDLPGWQQVNEWLTRAAAR